MKETEPGWMDKEMEDGKKFGDQRLRRVHYQIYEYPDKDGNGYDDIIQVRKFADTRRKLSSWMHKVENGEGQKDVEEFVDQLVKIAESDDSIPLPYGADQESMCPRPGPSCTSID